MPSASLPFQIIETANEIRATYTTNWVHPHMD